MQAVDKVVDEVVVDTKKFASEYPRKENKRNKQQGIMSFNIISSAGYDWHFHNLSLFIYVYNGNWVMMKGDDGGKK